MVGIMPKLFLFSGSVGVLDRKRILETCSKLHMHCACWITVSGSFVGYLDGVSTVTFFLMEIYYWVVFGHWICKIFYICDSIWNLIGSFLGCFMYELPFSFWGSYGGFPSLKQGPHKVSFILWSDQTNNFLINNQNTIWSFWEGQRWIRSY